MPDARPRLDLNLRYEEGKLLEFGDYGRLKRGDAWQHARDAGPRPMGALTGGLLRIDVGFVLRRRQELR